MNRNKRKITKANHGKRPVNSGRRAKKRRSEHRRAR